KGFNNNLRIAIRIESILKLYEGEFYGLKDSVLPKDFSVRRFQYSGHFLTLYSLMGAVFLLLLFLTFINPIQTGNHNNTQSQPPQHIQSQP
ncbi:hypothetical protein KAR91_44665, partial [Candidatus Pacearchaeota archaeon]|nr:hypothetical protein [Candidatus Pacearchaeota archaeon]